MVRLQKKGSIWLDLGHFSVTCFKALTVRSTEVVPRRGLPLLCYLFKALYINVLSALKWQASLNLSLNSQIEVDTVKNTSFKVILPHRMDLSPIGAI